MTEELDVVNLFKAKGALLEGHFILSSGSHSDRYLQSALVLQYPPVAETLGKALAHLFPQQPQTVLSPALGGLIIGQEVARAAGARAIFSEKDAGGKPVLRRGFSLIGGEKVLVIEDVITTGRSTKEVLTIIQKKNADLIGIGSLINRAEESPRKLFGKNIFVRSLLNLPVKSWKPEDCPLCRKRIPAIKPGSRRL